MKDWMHIWSLFFTFWTVLSETGARDRGRREDLNPVKRRLGTLRGV